MYAVLSFFDPPVESWDQLPSSIEWLIPVGIQAVADGNGVVVHLGLDVGLDLAVVVQPLVLSLVVEVAGVADDGLGDGVVNVDGGDLELVVLKHFVHVMDPDSDYLYFLPKLPPFSLYLILELSKFFFFL